MLALGSAVCFALQSASAKKAGPELAALWVAWAYVAGSIPCFLLYAVCVGEEFSPQPAMLQYVAISAVANFFALPAFFSAVQEGELSIVMPLSVLSPAFALVVEAILYGDRPAVLPLLGVLAIVAGAFALHATRRESWWTPFIRLGSDAAARKMLIATLAWGVAASADRGGVRASSAITYAITVHSVIAVLLLPLLIRAGRAQASLAGRSWRALVPPTLWGATMIVLQMVAMEDASAAMVIALKRLAALIAVLLGAFMFGERGWGRRLIASALMVTGAIMIGVGT